MTALCEVVIGKPPGRPSKAEQIQHQPFTRTIFTPFRPRETLRVRITFRGGRDQ